MNKKELIEFTQNKMEEFGLDVIDVRFDHRINSIGRCITRVNKQERKVIKGVEIIFHNSLLKVSEDVQKQIALHELAHYYASKNYGYESLVEEDEGHGKLFKKACKVLNCTHTTSTYKGLEVIGKYYLKCKACGKVVYTRNRMDDTLKYYRYCRCGSCNGELEFHQNY